VSKRAGLTVSDMSDMTRLAQLAANPKGATREEIYLAVTSLYRVQGPWLSRRELELMNDILRRLTGDVRMNVRAALAERLADDHAVPPELVRVLVEDAIEVARPLILRSPLLSDADCVSLLENSDVSLQETIASRTGIGEQVTGRLAEIEAEAVLVAMLRNASARISAKVFDALAVKARHVAALREPLARRPDLPASTALKMSEWLSVDLKSWIARTLGVEPGRISGSLGRARKFAHKDAEPSHDTRSSADRLIDKMQASGQLRAGFLLRVLQQGQIELFDAGLARLLELPPEKSKHQFYQCGPTAVALACRAVGIDRCVFPTVYTLSRHSRDMAWQLTPADMKNVDAVFSAHSRPGALALLHAA
jgi:uncharacterized protein (DUF2336 family)